MSSEAGNMKKICFFSNNNIGLGFSGGDRIFTELLKGWKPHAEMMLLGSEEAITISRRNGVDVTFLQSAPLNPNPQCGLFSLLTHTWRRIKAGIQALKTYSNELQNVDAVYSVSDFWPDFLPALVLKRRRPDICWIAGYYLFTPAPWSKETPYKGKQRLRGLISWLMQRPSYFLVKRYADKVFVTSEPDVQCFVTKRRSRDNVLIIQGGVDITAPQRYLASGNITPIEKRHYDACFIGRLHYQKGVLIILDIWHLLCNVRPKAKLAMIGDGHLKNEVRDKIIALGLQDNVEMLGFLDGERKFEVFKQSKLMVHPSTYDSGGMAAAEGMAWRLPGVSFDLEALKTYYPKGMVKIPCYDEQQFADAILRLLTDKAFYEQYAEEALSLILEVWDWRKRAERVWQALQFDTPPTA